MPELKLLVQGGNASITPAMAQTLGPAGFDLNKIIQEVNEKTKAFKGMKVPVNIEVDMNTKTYEIIVGTPPVSAIIKEKLGLKKAASDQKQPVGNLTFEELLEIAKMKLDTLNTSKLENAIKTVAGTCLSMGITIDGMNAKDFLRKFEKGEYDQKWK